MQELRLVAVSEDGTYLVLATAGRGTRFTLPVDDRLRAAVRGNFSRLGQYEIEVESPLRPKEIQARIRAGETAEEIAATAGIPVERVRWFEGPVLQEREYMAQQAQRVSVRMPGETTPGPTLGELVAERLTRRGVPADEIDWDSAKRDDNLWRVRLGFVWNGHTRHAEWLFDPRRRHITPNDDEAMRLSAAEYVEPERDNATVRPFVPRLASKLAPVPPLPEETSHRRDEPGLSVPAVRSEPAALPEPVAPPRLSPPLRAETGRPERPEPYADEPAAYRPELTPVPFRLPQSLIATPDVVLPPPPAAETRVEPTPQTGSAAQAAPPRTPAGPAPVTGGVPYAPGSDAAGDGAVRVDGQDAAGPQAASQPPADAVTPAPAADAAAPVPVTGGDSAVGETAVAGPAPRPQEPAVPNVAPDVSTGVTSSGGAADTQEAVRPATPVERASTEDSTTPTTTTTTTATPDSTADSAAHSTADSATTDSGATDVVAAAASSQDAEGGASGPESAEAAVETTAAAETAMPAERSAEASASQPAPDAATDTAAATDTNTDTTAATNTATNTAADTAADTAAGGATDEASPAAAVPVAVPAPAPPAESAKEPAADVTADATAVSVPAPSAPPESTAAPTPAPTSVPTPKPTATPSAPAAPATPAAPAAETTTPAAPAAQATPEAPAAQATPAAPAAPATPPAQPAAEAAPAAQAPARQEPAAQAPAAAPAPRTGNAGKSQHPGDGSKDGAKEAQKEAPKDAKPETPAPPVPKPAPPRPRKSRGRRASVPTWDEIMFGARKQD
ncbi:UNVERIFIED_ORG: hypothetical protein FHR35_003441 [Microbispora rosea subsp. rosea]